MCCLSYEYGYYSNTKKHIPKIGKRAATSQGEGKVIRQNVLTETITVLLDNGVEAEIKFDDFIQYQTDKGNHSGKTSGPDAVPRNNPESKGESKE
jgi:cell fate regulator YaaT (PSP1 superfamily)